MAEKKYTIKESTLTAIGNAIRSKSGTTDKLTPEQMAATINNEWGMSGGLSKTKLVEALQYSGLGITQNSTPEQIYQALSGEFAPYDYIFKANRGNLLTGTWNKNNDQGADPPVPSINYKGNLYTTFPGSTYCNYICKTPIDVTNYSKLFFTVVTAPTLGTNGNAQLNVGLSATNNNTTVTGSIGASVNIGSNTGTFEVDVSKITGNYYFGFAFGYVTQGTLEFSEIYFQ